MSLRPEQAHLISGDTITDIAAEDVMSGDLLLVRPGEQFPVDGILQKGSTEADLSHLTGESLPVSLEQGDKVFGGALNGPAAVDVLATEEVTGSLIGRIIDSVERAQLGQAPIQRLVGSNDGLLKHLIKRLIGVATLPFITPIRSFSGILQ